MKIFTLAYFDATDWRTNLADVVADSENEAKEILIKDRGVSIIERGTPDNNVTLETKKEWIDVEDVKEMPDRGILSTRAKYPLNENY